MSPQAKEHAKRPAIDVASVFFALGDKTRLQLIAVLCAGGAFSIAQLTASTDLTRQAVTKHLQTGQRIRMSGETGEIELLSAPGITSGR